MQQNTVVKKGDLVIKTFGSHLNYLKESTIYDRLRDTGLAPRITYEGNDTIEHEYVYGKSLQEMLNESADDLQKLAGCFRIFFDWYSLFRKKCGSNLEHMDFSKFIWSDEKLVCVDFEHCKAGYPESDIAKLAAKICLDEKPFSFRSMEICRLFLCVGSQVMTWSAERLAACLENELKALAKEKHIVYDSQAAAYLLTAACCCGVLFAADPLADVTAAMAFISTSPQRIIVCSEEGKPQCPSFSCMPTGSSPVTGLYTASKLIKEISQPWSLWLDASEKYTRESITALLSADKAKLDVLIASSESSGRIFPMLIRTDTARVALGSSLSSGATTLPQALKKLRVKHL